MTMQYFLSELHLRLKIKTKLCHLEKDSSKTRASVGGEGVEVGSEGLRRNFPCEINFFFI